MTPPCPTHSPGGWALYRANASGPVDWTRETLIARASCSKCALRQGVCGSARGVRTMVEKSKTDRRRSKCSCCGKRVTYVGLGDGVGLTSGCEWFVRRWVRDPDDVRRSSPRQSDRPEKA